MKSKIKSKVTDNALVVYSTLSFAYLSYARCLGILAISLALYCTRKFELFNFTLMEELLLFYLISGLNFKCYARKFGNRTGKKTTIAKRLEGSPEYSSDINRECKFRIPREDFMDHDITCSVGGKHKILGKKLHLGKVVIGNGSKDETGVVHWKTIFASPGIAWAVWHPIYSS